jgi:hypothetical protein
VRDREREQVNCTEVRRGASFWLGKQPPDARRRPWIENE